MERVSAGEPECRIVSVMQGAEGTGKGCQLVAVCNRKECRKRAGRPAREQLRKLGLLPAHWGTTDTR